MEGIGGVREGGVWEDMRRFTSLEPRPNPDTTLPPMRRGKGGSGPESGPIILARGASGRFILTVCLLLLLLLLLEWEFEYKSDFD